MNDVLSVVTERCPVGSQLAYSDWCFQAGAYAALLSRREQQPRTVLDTGCGWGLLVPAVLQILPPEGQYLGIAIDAGLIEQCRRRYTDRRVRFGLLRGHSPLYPHAVFPEAQPLDEHVAQDRWDIIIAKGLFDYLTLSNTEAYLRPFAINLAKDGWIIATFFVLVQVVS